MGFRQKPIGFDRMFHKVWPDAPVSEEKGGCLRCIYAYLLPPEEQKESSKKADRGIEQKLLGNSKKQTRTNKQKNPLFSFQSGKGQSHYNRFFSAKLTPSSKKGRKKETRYTICQIDKWYILLKQKVNQEYSD